MVFLFIGWSDIESKVDDVAILNDIFFSFEACFACGTDGFFGAEGFEVFVGDCFGLYEAAFYVGVDLAGGIECDGAAADGPGADLVGADCEEANEAESGIAAMNEFQDGGFVYSEVGHEGVAAFWVELGKLILELGADIYYGGIFGDDAGEVEFFGDI